MRIGVTKEIKVHEYRVGLVPSSVRELVRSRHSVVVERDAGVGCGFADMDYQEAGATIAPNAKAVFNESELIVKVKEPQASEIPHLREGQVLMAYLHLAADSPQTKGLLSSGAICIAYETVTDAHGGLPLLAPMSEIAGRMSVQIGARLLEKDQGGRGILLGGVAGVPPAKVLVLGGGAAGKNAARIAVGMGATVTIIDKAHGRLRELETQFGPSIRTLYPTSDNIEREVTASDLVIGAILVPGAAAQKVVTREMIRQMRAGSVVVDISIDQGGCFETSRPTTHDKPVYVEEDVTHYCVTNMPGAVPLTSTFGLNNVALPFIADLANKGWKRAVADDPHLRRGVNVHAGHITHEAVAGALGLAFAPLS